MSRWCATTAATAGGLGTSCHTFIPASRLGSWRRDGLVRRSPGTGEGGKLVQWIREEFESAPDLRLTRREAAAFLGLDLDTCERVLSHPLNVRALTQGPDGRFVAMSAVR